MRMTGEQRREQLLDATKAIVARPTASTPSRSRPSRARRASRARSSTATSTTSAGCSRRSSSARRCARSRQLPDTYDDLLAALTAYLHAVRSDPDTWRLVLMPQEGAPRLLHERIAAGRARVVERLAAALRPGTGLPDPELTAHMLSRLRRRGRPPDARGLRRGAHPRAHALGTLDKLAR